MKLNFQTSHEKSANHMSSSSGSSTRKIKEVSMVIFCLLIPSLGVVHVWRHAIFDKPPLHIVILFKLYYCRHKFFDPLHFRRDVINERPYKINEYGLTLC